MIVTWNPKNPMRRRLVFLEGVDKTGKSTLCYRVMHESGHDVLCYCRGPMSRRVYAKFSGSGYPIEDIDWLEEKLIKTDSYAVILLECAIKTLAERILLSLGHRLISPTILLKQATLFRREWRALRTRGVPTLLLDTSKFSEDECVRLIIAWLGGTWRQSDADSTGSRNVC